MVRHLHYLDKKDVPFAFRKGIYKIWFQCDPNSVYIGSAVAKPYKGNKGGLYSRMIDHICSLKIGKHFNMIVQNHFNKYGIENFRFEIVDLFEESLITKEYVEMVETAYIRFFSESHSIMNLNKEASTCVGRECSIEIKEELSRKRSGRYLLYTHDGKFVKEILKYEIPDFKPVIKTRKVKQGVLFKNHEQAVIYFGESTKKYLSCYTPDGKFVKTFEGMDSICKYLNITKSNSFFSRIYMPKNKTGTKIVLGYLWQYETFTNTPKKLLEHKKATKRHFVYCYNMNLEFVGKYESKFEAGKCIGLSNSAVSKGTRMTHNYSHGYFWSTVELTIEELKKKYSMIDFKRIVDRKKK